MNDTIDHTTIDKPVTRCAHCDREVDHYNLFISPSGGSRVICWECLAREEKGFNAARGYARQSRQGLIPR